MRTAFPREIRDIVYGKLVHFEDDPRRRVCVVFGRQTFRGTFLRYLPASALTGDDFSHEDPFEDLDSQFVKEDYVGPTVAREIAEAYYRSQTFIFEGIEFNHLHKFLHEDRFQTGVEPFRVIQHICLKIRAPILALRINYTYYYKLYTQIYLRLAGVFKGLDAIPGRATLLIDLIMGKHYDVVDETVPTRTTRLVDMMAFIEPSVRELKALGTRVEVAAQRPDPGALGRRSGDFLWFVFDTPSMPIEDFLTGAVKVCKISCTFVVFVPSRHADCYSDSKPQRHNTKRIISSLLIAEKTATGGKPFMDYSSHLQPRFWPSIEIYTSVIK